MKIKLIFLTTVFVLSISSITSAAYSEPYKEPSYNDIDINKLQTDYRYNNYYKEQQRQLEEEQRKADEERERQWQKFNEDMKKRQEDFEREMAEHNNQLKNDFNLSNVKLEPLEKDYSSYEPPEPQPPIKDTSSNKEASDIPVTSTNNNSDHVEDKTKEIGKINTNTTPKTHEDNILVPIAFAILFGLLLPYSLLKFGKRNSSSSKILKEYHIEDIWAEDRDSPYGKYLINKKEVSALVVPVNKRITIPAYSILKLLNSNWITYPIHYPIVVTDNVSLLNRGFRLDVDNGDYMYICCYRGEGLYYAIYYNKLISIPSSGISGLKKPYVGKTHNDHLPNWAKFKGKNTKIVSKVIISVVPIQANSNSISYEVNYSLHLFVINKYSIFFPQEEAIRYKDNLIKQLQKEDAYEKKKIYTFKYIDDLNDWRAFEEFVAKAFKNNGYSVYLTQRTNDGGKDIIVEKNHVTTYIECKYWNKNNAVGREPVQKLAGACLANGVKHAIFITTSGYHQNAIDTANAINRQGVLKIELWGKQKLIDFAMPKIN